MDNYLDDLRDQIAENRRSPEWPNYVLVFVYGIIIGICLCRLAMNLPILP